jgi:hypothetical protein
MALYAGRALRPQPALARVAASSGVGEDGRSLPFARRPSRSMRAARMTE